MNRRNTSSIELIRLFVTFGTLFVYSSSRHEF